MLVKELKGNSGCSIQLHKKDGVFFVRKQATTIKVSKRLEEQVNILSDIRKISSSPVILSTTKNREIFEYDMEFIEGDLFSRYTHFNSEEEILLAFRKILGFIEKCSKIKHSNAFSLNNRIVRKLNSLNEIIDVQEGVWSLVPKEDIILKETFCHGDMTFENIIIDKHDNCVFIDPLKPYLKHYFADISKLLKEVCHNWTYINSGVRVSSRHNSILLNELMNNALYNNFEKHHKILVCIDLLRTIPYLKDEKKVSLVNQEINKLCKK